MTTKSVYLTCPLSLSAKAGYCKVTSVELQMDFHEQKANLSFSIENILRDDFSHHHRRQTEAVNLQTREACFESWPCQPAVYRRCYLAQYSPYVLMKYPPPATQRVAARFQWRVNGTKAQRLPAKPKNIDDDCLSCKDEAIQKDDGKKFFILTVHHDQS